MKNLSLVCLTILTFSVAVHTQTVPENWYCDARWQADFIFTGKVSEINDFKGLGAEQPIPVNSKFKFQKTVTFEVEKIYKFSGRETTPITFSVHTVSRDIENPVSFEKGGKYLIFAEREGVIPISKNWIYADVVAPDGLTASFEKASETVNFLESVYKTDFDFLRDVVGYKGDSKTVSVGVVSGKATSLPKPPYPKEARKVRASGTINVAVVIDETGQVILAKAVCPSNADLGKAAEQAALAASFFPTAISGKAVKVRGVIVYNFVP